MIYENNFSLEQFNFIVSPQLFRFPRTKRDYIYLANLHAVDLKYPIELDKKNKFTQSFSQFIQTNQFCSPDHKVFSYYRHTLSMQAHRHEPAKNQVVNQSTFIKFNKSRKLIAKNLSC